MPYISVITGKTIGFLFIFVYTNVSISLIIVPLIFDHCVTSLSRHLSTLLEAIFLISPISCSDSLTYTNPLVIISGPPTIAWLSFSIATITLMIPSLDKFFLSLNTIFPTSPIRFHL